MNKIFYSKSNAKVGKIRESTKRMLPSKDGAKLDLQKDLQLLFKAFDEACDNFSTEVVQTSPKARLRGFESYLFNAKMVESIQKYFPNSWTIGKYGRFVLYLRGYIILIKKLNKKNTPLNVKSIAVEAISNQLRLPLFPDEKDAALSPILFFGYKKSGIGEFYEPKLVFIDDGLFKWEISKEDFNQKSYIRIENESQKEVSPKLKPGVLSKRKNA